MFEFFIIFEFFVFWNFCISNEMLRSIFRVFLNVKFFDENNFVIISFWEFDYNFWIEENDFFLGCIFYICLLE